MAVELMLSGAFQEDHQSEYLESPIMSYTEWFEDFTGYPLERRVIEDSAHPDDPPFIGFWIQFENAMDAIEFKLRWS